MVEYKEKIFDAYRKIKNLKYSQEVFGGALVAGGVLTEYYSPNLMFFSAVSLTFGFAYIFDGLSSKDKFNIFYDKKSLEGKLNSADNVFDKFQ